MGTNFAAGATWRVAVNNSPMTSATVWPDTGPLCEYNDVIHETEKYINVRDWD